MQDFQSDFIRFVLKADVLRFGEFTLKSGRKSPYFFNSGLFDQGGSLAQLGRFYAQALVHSKIPFNCLFGPAYKGIPLASSCAIALADQHQININYCFNRKEAKDHGEGGIIVGAPLKGDVMIIDDVITAGTSVRESFTLIERAGARVAGVIIALDRQEKGKGNISAIREIEQQYHIPVISIVTLEHLIQFLQQQTDLPEVNALSSFAKKLTDYQKRYGDTNG